MVVILREPHPATRFPVTEIVLPRSRVWYVVGALGFAGGAWAAPWLLIPAVLLVLLGRFEAMTIPLPRRTLILYRGMPSQYLRVHEWEHVWQRENIPWFLPRYFWELRRGYRRNRFEVDARAAADAARINGVPREFTEWR